VEAAETVSVSVISGWLKPHAVKLSQIKNMKGITRLVRFKLAP
jgi:hypothetical protein